jgi:hypothetical protein
MELFYGGGGNQFPDFSYKVRIKRGSPEVNEMMKWCDDYPTGDKGYFKRYYIDWRGGEKKYGDSEYTIFQFEWEEAAIMFSLSFADSIC